MPQFDKFTFAPQLCWTFILFLTLYIFFLRVSLPAIATTLKLRSRKLSGMSSSVVTGVDAQKSTAMILSLSAVKSQSEAGDMPTIEDVKSSPLATKGSASDSIRKSVSKYASVVLS